MEPTARRRTIRPFPKLARDFLLDANLERSRFEITSIEELAEAFRVSYTVDYFDDLSIEGGFLWLPGRAISPWPTSFTIFAHTTRDYESLLGSGTPCAQGH